MWDKYCLALVQVNATQRKKNKVNKPNKILATKPNKKEFIAFALLSELNNIDPYFRDGLGLRLCMGKNLYLKLFHNK